MLFVVCCLLFVVVVLVESECEHEYQNTYDNEQKNECENEYENIIFSYLLVRVTLEIILSFSAPFWVVLGCQNGPHRVRSNWGYPPHLGHPSRSCDRLGVLLRST